MALPPLYRPVADHLPPLYQEDRDSFAEVESYLGLVDEILRAFLMQLDDALAWLSPRAAELLPPGYQPGESRKQTALRIRAVLDELGRLFGYDFPGSWSDLRTENDLPDWETEFARKRRFLERVARLWRRRGTPTGFLSWFCLYFGLEDSADRPLLVEHFKYRPDNHPATGKADEYAHRMSLLAPVSEAFENYDVRREALAFVRAHAPAHLLVRLCWIGPRQRDRYKRILSKPDGSVPDDLDAVRKKIFEEIVSVVPSADGIHLRGEEIAKPRQADRLDLGRLATRINIKDV